MIEGRVAQVLNERELVINRGVAHGIVRGMTFEVLAEEPIRIIDPEDHAEIGVVDRPKVSVRVTDVHERFAICETFETRVVPGGALNFDNVSLARLFEPPRTRIATLKAEESALPPPLSERESFVKVGDRVELLREGLEAQAAESIAAAS